MGMDQKPQALFLFFGGYHPANQPGFINLGLTLHQICMSTDVYWANMGKPFNWARTSILSFHQGVPPVIIQIVYWHIPLWSINFGYPHGHGPPHFSDRWQEQQGGPQLEQSEDCRLSHQHLGNDAFLLSTWSSDDQPVECCRCCYNNSIPPGEQKGIEVTRHVFLPVSAGSALKCAANPFYDLGHGPMLSFFSGSQPFSSSFHDFQGTEEVEDNSSRQFPKSSRKEVERVVRQSQDLTEGRYVTSYGRESCTKTQLGDSKSFRICWLDDGMDVHKYLYKYIYSFSVKKNQVNQHSYSSMGIVARCLFNCLSWYR